MRPVALCTLLTLAASSLVALALAGCSASKTNTCSAPVPTECSPLYEPTYTEVFNRTLKPTCAAGGSSCHGGSQHGLQIDDIDATYPRVTSRLTAGQPACGDLIDRLYSTQTGYAMPPGRELSDAERCSIVKWIAAGAKR